MDVKSRLQVLMDERGWTMYRLAKESDLPWTTLRNMMKRNTEPTIPTLESVCNGLGISMSQFFDPDNQMGLTKEQWLLLDQWKRLSKSHQEAVFNLMVALNENKP